MGATDRRWFGLDRRVKPVVVSGVVLGVGFGGFFDGIVLHQILQWHHMLTSHPDPTVANDLPLNTLADGLFHAVAYVFTVVGVALVWRTRRRPDVPASTRSLVGGTLVGWGLFNLVEGVVDHHILGVHHVRPDGPGGVLLWDLGFLAWGAAMVGIGYLLVRSDPTAAPDGTATAGS